jgi:two-component system chemotaxis response regulator CheY
MKRCLLADNSAVIRKVARHFLTEDRWLVDEAERAEEVLTAFDANHPDLVIIDWQLAGRDPIDVIKAIRRSEDGARPRVLYLTSENDRKEIWRALSAGADDFLLKPFDRQAFAGKLAELLPKAEPVAAATLG